MSIALKSVSDLPEAYQRHITVLPTGCWEWRGLRACHGYPRFRGEAVHRTIAAWAYGPIPAGMCVDHNCHNLDPACQPSACRHRQCVNPAHLRIITSQQNTLASRWTAAGANASKTRCPAGHPFSGPNLYMPPSGKRRCRACMAAANARYRAKRFALAA